MNKKLFVRLLCALLSVLTLVAIVPATTISAAAFKLAEDGTNETYVKGQYADAEAYLNEMKDNGGLYYSNDTHELYCDETMGVVAYRNKITGEVLFTNPWNVNEGATEDELKAEEASSTMTTEKKEMLSQIVLTYSGGNGGTLYSYVDAAKKGQITVVPIKNGVRVEYAIGDLSPRILAPERIEKTAFEENILKPLKEGLEADYGKELGTWWYNKFLSYYNFVNYTTEQRDVKREALARDYPVLAEKNIDMYMLGKDSLASDKVKRDDIEAKIKKYTSYTLEMMDEDYDYLEYERADASPPVFKLALEYVIDDFGLSVTLPANGLRYDESVYRISSLIVLPYMGASLKTNGGYSFVADGSGTLYELDSQTQRPARVYGDDYALQDESNGGNITIKNHQVMRMPVYGQVEYTYTDKDGNALTKAEYNALTLEEQKLCNTSKSGYFAIIEEGDALASVITAHAVNYRHALIKTEFITRQKDKFEGGWSDYAKRRYVENYKIRYIMLTDDQYSNKVSSYYECSWMGMACAYRDYLDKKDDGFNRLTTADLSNSGIPLYIETFGCMDTIEKKLSMPVTVSKALTTFDDVATMYDYLCENGVKNVNFKLKGYANGGLYSEVPYKLKWESAVGGASGFEDLIKKAKTEGFGVYPDFDFVYTSQSDAGSSVSLKKHAARTIFNRYTTKRAYSSTYQAFVSYFQMVMAPATYAHFYEKLSSKYEKYEATGISLGTFGSALNSDFDEEKTSLREETKEYIVQGLDYFKKQNYSVMVDAGNAFTWSYVDHILSVPLDSSRYSAEMSAVPFIGVVLHGYKQFASTPLNMEGNLSYAMLKAMESGASVYFILSYANTQLLKEDEVLSQNYSVRYDIWQKQLVEIYQELNNVLADVQTKLITKHEVLNLDASTKTVRIPDQDELLKDIAQMAEDKKLQIEQKLDAERQAIVEATRTARETVKAALTTANTAFDTADKAAKKLAAWTLPAEITDAVLERNVIANLVSVKEQKILAENAIIAAQANLKFLDDQQVNEQLIDEAEATLVQARAKYAEILTVLAAAQASYDAIKAQVSINMDALLAAAEAKLPAVDTYTDVVVPPVVMEEASTDVAKKYKVDNNVVAVTYGNDDGSAYKTLLLNFNDYTIQTTYNGVTYTIAAYEYVVIKY